MFVSIAIPKILYAVDVWGVPKPIELLEPHRKGTSRAIKKLTTTQRAGTLAVTGGLRTTPTDVLDTHAFILPIHLEIDKHCDRAATRIATLPPAHANLWDTAKRHRKHKSNPPQPGVVAQKAILNHNCKEQRRIEKRRRTSHRKGQSLFGRISAER